MCISEVDILTPFASQHLIFTQGKCKAIIAGEEQICQAGDLCIVPQGTEHNCKHLTHKCVLAFWLTSAVRFSHQHW